MWDFHTHVSWWSFTGVWVSASLFRTFLSILANLNNAIVWMVSIHPLIFSPSILFFFFFPRLSSPRCKPLGTIPSVPFTSGITVILMFHIFFVFFKVSGKVQAFVSLFVFFYFHTMVYLDGKVPCMADSLFYYYYYFYIFHQVFTQDLGWGRVVIIYILCICCFFFFVFFLLPF